MTGRFHITQGNPAPPGAEVGVILAKDRRRLRYATVPAAGPARGTVVLLTGRNEAIEKYFETVRDLTGRGFQVVAMDWRGQGGSDRLLRDPVRGHVRSFEDYADDLVLLMHAVVAESCPPPFHILAHSAGGLVALLAEPKLRASVRRIVTTAPLLGLDGYPLSMKGIHRVARAMSALGLASRYIGAGGKPREIGFEANVLTSDRGRYERNRALTDAFPLLRLGGPTAGWVRAACDAIATVTAPGFIAGFRTPTLLVAAGLDRVVSTPAIERFAAALPAASLVTVDGARHEILQEADRFRDRFFAAFDAFVPGGGELSPNAAGPAPTGEARASPPR